MAHFHQQSSTNRRERRTIFVLLSLITVVTFPRAEIAAGGKSVGRESSRKQCNPSVGVCF